MSNFFIATSSIVEENVQLGDGTKVWYFSHIMTGAKLGRDCVVGDHVFIGRKVMIGDNCRIGNGCQLVEGVVLKDNVRLGLGVKFTNVRKPSIKKSKKLLDTLVSENATIESDALVQGGVKIGKGAVVGANSTVIKDVPDNAFVVGSPARIIDKNEKRNNN